MTANNEQAVSEAVNAQKLDVILGNMDELKAAVRELTKSVNRLAIIEERQAATSDSLGRAFKEIEKHDNRIKVLEQAQPMQQHSSDLVQKVLYHVVTIAITAVLTAGFVSTRAPAASPPAVVSK